jgi:RHS repeat-associated protein
MVLALTLFLCVESAALSAVAVPVANVKESDGINRTVPKVPPPSAAITFSSTPSDAEFLRVGLFAEPLAPTAATNAPENRELAKALLAYRDAVQRTGDADSVAPLLAFLGAHPDSPWKPALQLDIGIVYRQTGHFFKALQIWQTGWSEAQHLKDPEGRALANAIVARLSQLEAYLGRKELLQPLLDTLDHRMIGGTAAQLITDSHTGLYEMLHQPEDSFRCGPLALKRILNYGGATPSPVSMRVLDQAHSTPNGLSLNNVQQIAAKAGMKYQMAFRTPGAAILMPAVAHWKVGHYAAIVDRVDGRLIVEDTTFGEDIRVRPTTLDEEASGYFLVPTGPLPQGWRPVSASEGAKVWGRGNTGQNHDSGNTGLLCTNGGCTSAGVELQVVGLQLSDAPVGYTPPVGPAIQFTMVYSHRDTQQPTTFSYTNFGPKWTFNWLSYITDTINSNGQAVLYRRGGGNEPFSFASSNGLTSYPGPYSQGILTRGITPITGVSTGFSLTFPDGSAEQFTQSQGQKWFLTSFSDPSGNTVSLTYDSQMRVVAITDAIGQVSTISYGLSSNPLLVTQITDPFGRSAGFTYNSSGLLASITDVLGITSSYTYGQGTDPDFINTLTTPYGSTTFVYGDSTTNSSLGDTRFLKTTDPLNRTRYVEFNQGVDPGDSSGGVLKNSSLLPVGMNTCNQYLYYRNTFVFDPNQYALATQGGSLNYSLAHVIHWLHSSDETSTSRFIESEKQPLENRIWYNYPGQPSGSCGSIFSGVSSTGVVTNGASIQPTAIGRVLDNGTTQLMLRQYNSQGNVTQTTDPVGRQITNTYAANGIDLLTVTNTTSGTQVLETVTYNSQHLPLTITGPNGMTARYQYNAAGQKTRYTDQQGHASTYTYDGSGRLTSWHGPISGAQYSFAYDNVSRLTAMTDIAGSTVHITYDAADRPAGTTFPDGTTALQTYHLLDVASSTDRLGQTTHFSYDADRELVQTTDALSHATQLGYNLASQLNSLTDQNNHTTTITLDAEGRPVTKLFADGTSQSVIYENSVNLVAAATDALGQTTTYTYNTDNTKAAVGYSTNQPTPSVSFTYDPAYQRVTSMTDGNGTTTYTYYPVATVLGANELKSVTSPIAGGTNTDTVVYTYDALDRVIGTAVNGVARAVTLDALGRPTAASNMLDTFTYNYADATTRVSGVTSLSGPLYAMSYFGPQGNELLQQTSVISQSGTSLAQFGYTYNSNSNVAGFTASAPAESVAYTYDAINRLQTASIGAASSPQYAYGYDPASNLTSITANGPQQSFSYTAANALTSETYDANGSPLTLSGKAFTWDGANRVVSVTGSANSTSAFTYDGVGHLVRVVDSSNGTVIADHAYLWCGDQLCLAHDNTQSGSPVSTQYFQQGVIADGVPYYYVRDALGSVRQLIGTNGQVAAQYDYDPYGNLTALSGTLISDIGYAGYFYHAASGLEFAGHRAYDPSHARWLNRDPVAEQGGINLYTYVQGNPLSYVDPQGTWASAAIGFGAGFFGSAIGQYLTKGCINLGDALIAGLFGALAGLIGPNLSAAIADPVFSWAAAAALAGVTNALQYVYTAYVDDQPTTPGGFDWALGTGIIAGAIGGAAPTGGPFSTNSPWLNQAQAAVDNFFSQDFTWYGSFNAVRAAAGSAASNVPEPPSKPAQQPIPARPVYTF